MSLNINLLVNLNLTSASNIEERGGCKTLKSKLLELSVQYNASSVRTAV